MPSNAAKKRETLAATVTDRIAKTTPWSARPIRTLVIEDSEFDAKRLQRMCEDTGLFYDLTVLEGFDPLRQALDTEKFDLVVVDYQLTEGDGLDAIRRIRAHPAHLTTALLMLTGRGDTDLAVKAMKEGCADFLDKAKLNPNALRRATLNALEKSQLHQDLMRARGLNDKLANLVEGFARDSATQMKPLVLQIMRLARTRLNSPVSAKDEDAQSLDIAARKLWKALEAIEQASKRI